MSKVYIVNIGSNKELIEVHCLWSGEDQIFILLNDLQNLSYSSSYSFKLFIYSHFSNTFAHKYLYQNINNSYSLCVKIDGDMSVGNLIYF